jgi:hypothetical protein
MKTKASNAARAVRAKLQALAERPGTPEEGAAAHKKLARLLEKYDFSQADISKDDIFKGTWRTSTRAAQVARLEDYTLSSHIKWAIEAATGIPCMFHGDEIHALTDPRTAAKLAGIADTIAAGFRQLWEQFSAAPGVIPQDKPLFFRGLYDGMMNEARSIGQPLPQRATTPKTARAKRRAVGHVAGLNLHPYTVAEALGRQIRFSVPLPTISNELQTTIAGALPANN